MTLQSLEWALLILGFGVLGLLFDFRNQIGAIRNSLNGIGYSLAQMNERERVRDAQAGREAEMKAFHEQMAQLSQPDQSEDNEGTRHDNEGHSGDLAHPRGSPKTGQ